MVFNIIQEQHRDLVFSGRFSDAPPFSAAKRFAARFECDLTVLNGPGIGDVVCFSRLVEDYARKLGHPLRLLTAPLMLHYGRHPRDSDYPIWDNNPFVGEIVNADEIDPEIMREVICEKDNLFQYRHVIHNMGHCFHVPPNVLRPSLYLSKAEMDWAIKTLSGFPRPLVCLHPSGVSSSPEGTPWYRDRWLDLLDRFDSETGFLQVGRRDYRFKGLPVAHMDTTVREAMALVWASDVFVGFDSGLAHIATAFEKPSVVLWDAVHKSPIEEAKEPGFALATLSRWAYPQNENILLLGDKEGEVVSAIEHYIRRFNRLLY